MCGSDRQSIRGEQYGLREKVRDGCDEIPVHRCVDHLGAARNLVVAPNGDIFVSLRNGPTVQGQPPQPGFILGLRDTDGDGKIDLQEKFGTQGATGIRLRNGYLYYATPTSIERFKMTPGSLKPAGPAEVLVGDF